MFCHFTVYVMDSVQARLTEVRACPNRYAALLLRI